MVNNDDKELIFTARLEGELKKFFLAEKKKFGVKAHSEALRTILKRYLILKGLERQFEDMKVLFRTILETYEKDTGNTITIDRLYQNITVKKELGEALDSVAPQG